MPKKRRKPRNPPRRPRKEVVEFLISPPRLFLEWTDEGHDPAELAVVAAVKFTIEGPDDTTIGPMRIPSRTRMTLVKAAGDGDLIATAQGFVDLEDSRHLWWDSANTTYVMTVPTGD